MATQFNIHSLSQAVGVIVGDIAAVRAQFTSALEYAVETRMISGRDTAFENGKLAALSLAGQTVTKDTRKQVQIAQCLKAGFYALPASLPNYAAAYKADQAGTQLKIDIEVPALVAKFFTAFDAAAPAPKPVKGEADVKAAKDAATKKKEEEAIVFAKDHGYVLAAELPQAPTLAEYIGSASEHDLVNALDLIRAELANRNGANRALHEAKQAREQAQAHAQQMAEARLLADKLANDEQRAELTTAAIKANRQRKDKGNVIPA